MVRGSGHLQKACILCRFSFDFRATWRFVRFFLVDFLTPASIALRVASSICAGEVAGGEVGAAGEVGSGEAVVGEEVAAGMMNDVDRILKYE